MMKLAGELACQENPALRRLTTKVVKVAEAGGAQVHAEWVKNAVAEAKEGKKWWVAQLEDTVLFPEGGGQPFDVGQVGGAYCANVQRVGLEVWHLVDEELEEGAEVDVEVAWARRWDHMQQHTAQHMLTAVCEGEPYGLPTMCWGMGEDMSYIQLPVNKLPEDKMREIEDRCNEHIREQINVVTTTVAAHVDPNAPADDNAKGAAIRTVEILGVDKGPCCGTHISNLSHLQLLKLLHVEPKGNTLRLFFVAGSRALRMLTSMYDRERSMVKLLGTFPADLHNAASAMKKSNNASKKTLQTCFKELGQLQGDKMALAAQPNELIFHHYDEADMLYLMAVADRIVAKQPTAFVICSGEKKPSGEKAMLMVCSSPERLAAAVAEAEKAFAAKGGSNRGKWRGKLAHGKGMDKFEKAVRSLEA
eukprot:TRINITY_DN20401_c0_g1_i1.p2 TRINITY_DN20401_c0_g1~~TRINITY_DN20401_c0_g1_i1.p2  ORF type:complete len:419 (+),score=196.10 TRINITY_DN20401_c0_g1_i1:74-1330(+)